MLEIEIKTAQTIQYLVRELPLVDQDKALKKSFGNAALVFKKYARQNILTSMGSKTGHLRSSLTHKVYDTSSNVPAVVGFTRSAGNHAHLLDLGTTDRYTRKKLWKGTRYRGRGPATYFFTRARDEGQAEAMDAIYEGVQCAIERINSRR